MFITTEKIPLPRRSQIFNDDAAMDAAVAAQHDKQVRWVKYIMDDLTTAIRKIGGHKPS
jgi:hypothetical protein